MAARSLRHLTDDATPGRAGPGRCLRSKTIGSRKARCATFAGQATAAVGSSTRWRQVMSNRRQK
ncbi:hypothetical protein D8B29_26555 [Verminephrobacter eiseniae]|nr:hypothetical protein [Verminephrobacter eiseniae]